MSAATTTSSRNGAGSIQEHAKSVADDARALKDSVADTVDASRDEVRAQLEKRPYLTLGVAAATGFVLAGGLGPKITRGLFALGTRLAIAAAARKLVAEADDD